MDDDEARFSELFAGTYGEVRRYVYPRGGDVGAADDVVAETFLTAWHRLDDVPRDDPVPWLLAVARDAWRNERRYRSQLSDTAEWTQRYEFSGNDVDVTSDTDRMRFRVVDGRAYEYRPVDAHADPLDPDIPYRWLHIPGNYDPDTYEDGESGSVRARSPNPPADPPAGRRVRGGRRRGRRRRPDRPPAGGHARRGPGTRRSPAGRRRGGHQQGGGSQPWPGRLPPGPPSSPDTVAGRGRRRPVVPAARRHATPRHEHPGGGCGPRQAVGMTEAEIVLTAMSRCEECGFDWEMPAGEVVTTIARLGASYRSRLRDPIARARAVRQTDLIRVRPEPDVWSALEHTAHVRDVVDFSMGRIERVLHEDRPALPAVDFTSMAETRRYRDEDVATVLDASDHRSTAASADLGRLAAEEWSRVGLGGERGERSVLVLARRLAPDGHHHLMDLRRGLAALTKT
jgi:S-DNA-T family DNA segregation ATPase FtsK/SpoIIIE